MKPSILPTIHSNGTKAEDLRDGYIEMFHAAQAVRDAFQKVEFNARDYYPQGPEAFSKAQKEMTGVLKSVQDASDYFMHLATHCDGFCK